MKKSHSENTVGPWAKQKLDALEAYLQAYMLVMQNQPFDLTFIDAFAGAGLSRVRNVNDEEAESELFEVIDEDDVERQDEYIKGSPLRALGLNRPFNRYYFFDEDPRRVALLEDMKGDFPDRKMIVRVGDANTSVVQVAKHFDRWNRKGVAFLDPYGAHLHWSTIEALAKTKSVDVIINFPLGMAINRLITRDGEIPKKWRDQLDNCFGTPEWEDRAYSTDVDLFGVEDTQKRKDTAERLLRLYTDRLKTVFKAVAKPSLVTNTKGAPLYYLIWAGHPTGLDIAEHVLNLGERISLKRKK